MKRRIVYLVTLFALYILVFVLMKPVFMLYNDTFAQDCSLKDFGMVMLYGLKLDSTMAGYLIVVPFLLIWTSIWYYKINLRKVLFAYYAVIALLISLVGIVDMTLYEFWNFKLDATIFFYLDSPVDAFASVSVWFTLVRLIVILILTVILFWAFMRITPGKVLPVIYGTNKKLGGSLLMILLGGLIFIAIRGGVTESTSNVGRVYFSSNQFLNHSAVNPCFSLFYSLGKSEDFAGQFNFFPEEKRALLFEGLYNTKSIHTKKLLKTTRPNILIIQMESFTGAFIEALGGEAGVTPNLNKLTKEGVFFTNCYANSFRSDRGTVCNFSGYLGLPTTSPMKIPAKSQTLPGIARTLYEAGYTTDFLYGGDIDFTNMQSYFRSTGYQDITSDKDFTYQERHTHAWGVNDDITFEYLAKVIKERKDSLWHTGFFTLSSHDPFIVPYHRLENKITNAIAYTDECLGKFITEVKQTPAWDNLLIICIPDHGYCYPAHVTKHDPVFFHIPMLWLGGAVNEPMVIDKIVNQSDMAATLLGQMDLPHDEFNFSRDVFSESYKYPFAFTTFNNGFTFRDSTGISVYDNNADMIILEQPSHSDDRLDKGKAILQTLYDDFGGR